VPALLMALLIYIITRHTDYYKLINANVAFNFHSQVPFGTANNGPTQKLCQLLKANGNAPPS